MSSTVQIEQGRWSWLDAFLVSGGSGVSGITSTNVTVYYKKYGGATFATKTLGGTATTLALDVAAGATSVVLADSSIFPPDFGVVTISDGINTENVTITANATSINTITFTPALANTYLVATPTNVTLNDWGQVTGPPNGFYSILFNPTELDTRDQFVYAVTRVGGPAFDDFNRTVDIVEATSAQTESAPTLATCIIKDHILDLGGAAVQNVGVYARLLALPDVVVGVAVKDEIISGKTDANGFFQLTLIQGATVDIIIPSTGYRRTIVVPSTTIANLFEIV